MLKKILHGKTQNTNESVKNVIWVHCPKTVFVVKNRVDAAVANGVAKFNRGNFQMAEVMNAMCLPASDFTINILEARDTARIRQADKSAEAQFAVQRRLRRQRDAAVRANQEDREGEMYGPGLMADH
ncbi:hypothetical protein V1264_002650 [Littorina saxatilis]|uniref:Uncharacterized protein n=1 Tax=Littorina saxatilis TaxID=31220 RepID=A0AAN9B468_9CAEN